MKAKQENGATNHGSLIVWTILLLCGVPCLICAQENEANRKLFSEIKSKAEIGDAVAQFTLARRYADGDGVAKDEIAALKWYRRAAEQGYVKAQCNVGYCYYNGVGVAPDRNEAVRWFRKAADQGFAPAQNNLAACYGEGQGTAKDSVEAVRWLRKAADQGLAAAQFSLATCYFDGDGLTKNPVEGVKWYRRAADQGDGDSQYRLGTCCLNGDGTIKDYVEAHKWFNLASAQGNSQAKQSLRAVELRMTAYQISEAQRLARDFKPQVVIEAGTAATLKGIVDSRPKATGSGFFISDEGFLVTNEHVVRDASQIRLVSSAGFITATVLKVDSANDLALLKAEGNFSPLPITSSRSVKLGATVATVGFPNIGLQGFAPKLAKGEIASLTGAADDPRYFQISVAVQPGNSGGALVDARGNVVGIVSAKLNAAVALQTSGALPENVNYAIKSSFLLSFLESVPEVTTRLKEPETKERKFEDVVKSAEQAAVLVLVY